MSYQKYICQGRMVRDPDLRQIPSGTSVCDFAIAVESGWGDNKKTAFIDVTVWGKQGETFAQYFKKGDLTGVIEGEIIQANWEKDGQKRSKFKLTAHKWTFPPNHPVDSRPPEEKKNMSKPQKSDWAKTDEEVDKLPF